MKATIDSAGRLVIPKQLRDRLGLVQGEVDVEADEADLPSGRSPSTLSTSRTDGSSSATGVRWAPTGPWTWTSSSSADPTRYRLTDEFPGRRRSVRAWTPTSAPRSTPASPTPPPGRCPGRWPASTGTGEQKYRNLEHSPEVVLATGDGATDGGLDVVVEGTAVRVTDGARLLALAAAWEAKYGPFWRFDVRDGAFHHGGGPAHVFAVAPRKVLGFVKAPHSAQLRWRP